MDSNLRPPLKTTIDGYLPAEVSAYILDTISEYRGETGAVVIESMKDREESDLVDIDALIFCERDSHKGIVIGRGGAMLKKIASAARSEIEEFLGVRVNLQCWVKVREDWRNREGLIRNFGLES